VARAPILVTGMHRSGTTWVGRMLAASGEAVYLHEPLNPDCSPVLLHVPVEHQYLYLTEENEDGYPEAFARLLRFPLDSRRLERSPGQRARRLARLLHARATGARGLLKDPFAVFSIPWFARRLDAEIVVVVRHPLAVAASAKRLHWGFDTSWLLDQPLLMRDRLEPFRQELEAQPDTLAGQTALLWKIVYATVLDYTRELPRIRLVLHEDLSRRPLEAFPPLFDSLGLSFGRRARRAIARTTSEDNPAETDLSVPGSIMVDAEANLESWRKRLEPDEIATIESTAGELAASLYS
jgi:hypothetical protein